MLLINVLRRRLMLWFFIVNLAHGKAWLLVLVNFALWVLLHLKVLPRHILSTFILQGVLERSGFDPVMLTILVLFSLLSAGALFVTRILLILVDSFDRLPRFARDLRITILASVLLV